MPYHNQLEYIARQFSKVQKKVFEHYVVTRIWHQLNDLEIKFVTQQYVKRPEGYALTDMYFPQLRVHLEVDEGQHFIKDGFQITSDIVREADIISVTQHHVKHIKVAGMDLQNINKQIVDLIYFLKKLKNKDPDFRVWNYDDERNPDKYINLGYIDVKDDVAFQTMVGAIRCFGRQYKHNGIRTGGVRHPKEKNKIIWFPKLYENNGWNNSISDNDEEIKESCNNKDKHIIHVQKSIEHYYINKIVFAQVISPLGDIMYRFKGEYKIDLEKTNQENVVVYKRIETRVSTYNSKMS